MRQIRLTHYSRPNKQSVYKEHRMYIVGIPTGIRRFGSEKETLAFLAQTSRYLNDILAEGNHHLAQLFVIYRLIYFQVENVGKRKSINEEFIHVEDYLNRSLAGHYSYTANYSEFKYIAGFLKSLRSISRVLDNLLVKFREDAVRQNLRIILSRLDTLIFELARYPEFNAEIKSDPDE